MAANPDSIPRYDEPTWEEYAEMAEMDDGTPMDIMDRCNHQDACLRLLAMLDGPLPDGIDGFGSNAQQARASAAERLGCADCTEWELC